MFIFLSKLLPLFIYPLGLSIILMIAALLVHHNRKTSRGLVLAAALILWLSSTTGFSNLLARSLEWRFLPPEEIPTSEVIVLLGGGTEPAAYPRSITEINGAGDRVLYVAKLFAEGKAPRILLSGGEIAWLNDGASTPAQDMANILVDIGVPESALILENESQNTYENALMAKEILSELEIDQILLVTSALHMPRAVALFEKQGFEVIPLPVDYSVTENEPIDGNAGSWANRMLNIIPSASNIALTTSALKEYLGMLIYTLQGWM
jgi:uncharacterized SAM-binding protein YcdF (DUF218 family)